MNYQQRADIKYIKQLNLRFERSERVYWMGQIIQEQLNQIKITYKVILTTSGLKYLSIKCVHGLNHEGELVLEDLQDRQMIIQLINQIQLIYCSSQFMLILYQNKLILYFIINQSQKHQKSIHSNGQERLIILKY